MKRAAVQHLRDLGRGMIGALIFAAPFLYTMETWWLSWRLPGEFLVVYALVGVAIVATLVRVSGIRSTMKGEHESKREVVRDTIELVLQSFLAGFAVLFLFGVLQYGDPFSIIARMGLVQMVPLALGASIANRALAANGNESALELPFPHDVALFAVGVLYVALPIVPTEEMDLIATHASWMRLMFFPVASLLLAYLVLFELEFRGQGGRRHGLTVPLQVGEVFLVYGVSCVVGFLLLAVFGHFEALAVEVWVQKTVVLSFLGTLGGSAARVVF